MKRLTINNLYKILGLSITKNNYIKDIETDKDEYRILIYARGIDGVSRFDFAVIINRELTKLHNFNLITPMGTMAFTMANLQTPDSFIKLLNQIYR